LQNLDKTAGKQADENKTHESKKIVENTSNQMKASFVNAPRIVGSNVFYLNQVYINPILRGSCGWLSEMLEHLIDEAKVFHHFQHILNHLLL